MDALYVFLTLLCPLSMVALVAWWVWSMGQRGGSSTGTSARSRSAVEEGELARMRASLDHLESSDRQRA